MLEIYNYLTTSRSVDNLCCIEGSPGKYELVPISPLSTTPVTRYVSLQDNFFEII